MTDPKFTKPWHGIPSETIDRHPIVVEESSIGCGVCVIKQTEGVMRTIQVLGTGCSKCKTLAENAERAVTESGVEARVLKVQEIVDILTYDGVRGLPALAVDGEVKVWGRVPGVDEIKALIGATAIT